MAQKILVVDDDRDSLKLIGLMLQRRGYLISVAQTGAQALVKAENESPDLIILDVMLPDIDGYEVCRRIRANPLTVELPIIVVSARTQEADKLMAAQLGANGYLTKPYRRANLLAMIQACLSKPTRSAA